MRTGLLLLCSNVFMTFAWYGHLKRRRFGRRHFLGDCPGGILLRRAREPARVQRGFSGFQLKIVQEVITLLALWFSAHVSQKKLAWNYLVAFLFLAVAAFFAFAFKVPPPGHLPAGPSKPESSVLTEINMLWTRRQFLDNVTPKLGLE